FAAAVVTMLAATTGAILNRGAAWVGFAVFGWGGLLLAFAPSSLGLPTPLTSMVLVDIDSHLPDRPAPIGARAADEEWVWVKSTRGTSASVSLSYLHVGQSLFVVVMASVGGLAGPRVANRGVPRPE